MEFNPLQKLLIGLASSFLLLLLGLILLTSNDSFNVQVYSYRSDGFSQSALAGTGVLLFLPLTLLYVIYQFKEWMDLKKRERIQSYYHPLDPGSRNFADDRESGE